ncbi:DNA cytosine methyltransferase [Streptomyces coeruleorubidus]|uniref:Cytosine-specific methyltransferase n=1 Tax=Streptomyces coeruleorubidus TaxID=116188 RepID=A0ABZ0KF66_STRC4|nr:DNA (cytosine-5-)-methyltransferase [Streptomyces coeruleorubidus]WOT36627.1 DNA (cytosine-5-)-methyltransferase [Streptomyces coeruleorubidus]
MRPSGQQRPQFASPLTSIEICAGAGGQAVGLHNAGFDHLALVEWEPDAVDTLRANVGGWPGWTTERAKALRPMDVTKFLDSEEYKELGLDKKRLDLLAGGVPCPPFSLAGKRLGKNDERDLFPAALEITEALLPKAVMIENVRGILEPPEVFIEYRIWILNKLRKLGYVVPEIDASASPRQQDHVMRRVWRRLDASDFGVPQLRPRAILVAIHKDAIDEGIEFVWPRQVSRTQVSVVGKLRRTMRERCEDFWDKNQEGELASPGDRTGRDVFYQWLIDAKNARDAGRGVAPTLVGGSRKHGGADLGPTRAKRAWGAMGVNAMGVANDRKECDPKRDLFRPDGPMLTVEQAAIIQGFPRDWDFQGKKTARYRQVGNAFPPPVAEAVGRAIAAVLRPEHREELLEGYVMDANGSSAPAKDPEQMEFPVSGVPASDSAGYDRSGDFVGAPV